VCSLFFTQVRTRKTDMNRITSNHRSKDNVPASFESENPGLSMIHSLRMSQQRSRSSKIHNGLIGISNRMSDKSQKWVHATAACSCTSPAYRSIIFGRPSPLDKDTKRPKALRVILRCLVSQEAFLLLKPGIQAGRFTDEKGA